jgi:hypothetical protein
MKTLRLGRRIVFAFVEPPQFSSCGRTTNHLFRFMRELAHNLEQFKVPADRGIQFKAGEQKGETLVTPFAYLGSEAA